MPKVEIQVGATKDKAQKLLKKLAQRQNVQAIYTDGSGIKGKVGAVMYCAAIGNACLQHLGSEAQYNVYMAEFNSNVSFHYRSARKQ